MSEKSRVKADSGRSRDLLLEIGHERVSEVPEAAGLAVGLDPRKVGELGVDADSKNLLKGRTNRGVNKGISCAS